MRKFLKYIVIILLSLILIVVGCIIANNIYEKKKSFYSDYNQIMFGRERDAKELQNLDVDEIKSRKDDKSLIKEKEEFMQLFKEFCGFSLPDYFVFRKDINDFHLQILEKAIYIHDYFVFKKMMLWKC